MEYYSAVKTPKGTQRHHVQPNKSGREGQISNDLIHIWDLTNRDSGVSCEMKHGLTNVYCIKAKETGEGGRDVGETMGS